MNGTVASGPQSEEGVKSRQKIRVLLVDDHKIVRDGLRTLLEFQPDMEVIAEASDGRSALDLVEELYPDVVIMDLAMPVMNGIEATRCISERNSGVKIIGLSMYSDRRLKEEIVKAGAVEYLEKDCAFDDLVRLIRRVMSPPENQ